MGKEKTPIHRPTLIGMIVLIVVLLIGIAIRWDYIKKEASDAMNRIIHTEQTETAE